MPSIPTINDVQVVNPVLTNMLVGYQQNDERFVASRVFPNVPVDKDSGTYYIFDKKYWFVDELPNRAPGSHFEETGFGLSTSTYSTLQWAIEEAIPVEVRRNSQVPFDLEQAAVRHIAQLSNIRKERAFAADFMVNSVWDTNDNNSTTDWDDFSSGDPVSDVLTARRTISNSTGQMANTLVCGHIVHNALVNHPDILDRMKYTQAATMANVNGVLANLLGLENYWPAMSSYNSANTGQAASMSAVIDDDALVTYVTPSPGIFEASAGYTFTWDGGGGPGEISNYFDASRKSDIVQHQEQWDQKAVATDLGYLFLDVV